MRGKGETVWWSLFAAGGVVAAMLMPIAMIVTGILVPAGLVDAEGLSRLVHNPLSRLVLFGLISLALFHAAHRLLFTLADLGLKSMRGALAFVLYGGAIVGTILAAALTLRL